MTAGIEAAAAVLGDRARRDEPLAPRTTYKVGGPAALFLEIESEGDLRLAHQAIVAGDIPVLVVGRGSNLLVADAGFPGLAVTLGEPYAGLAVDGTLVRAGGGLALPVLARRTAAFGLRGLEWAVGVPGSVGGGVRMNAGGHGSDIAARLEEVHVADVAGGQDGRVTAGDLDLGYRRSAFRSTDLVLEATFRLEEGDAVAAGEEVAEIVRWRRANQPGGQNAGSVFTNPPGDSAGRLVDAAGCKGLRLGTAEVSTKHANFVQADAGGRAEDVVALIAEVRRRVLASTGVLLEPELKLVGFSNPLPEVEG